MARRAAQLLLIRWSEVQPRNKVPDPADQAHDGGTTKVHPEYRNHEGPLSVPELWRCIRTAGTVMVV